MLLDRSQECSTERSVRIRIAESSGKMSPVTRPGGRQLFLFPPGSGSGGSWIKLCWGRYNERGKRVTHWHRYLMRLGKCLQLWSQICVMDRGDWFSLLLLSLLLFTFLLQLVLGLGDLGFPASHYPECRPDAVFCLSLIPDITSHWSWSRCSSLLIWHHSLTPPDTL